VLSRELAGWNQSWEREKHERRCGAEKQTYYGNGGKNYKFRRIGR